MKSPTRLINLGIVVIILVTVVTWWCLQRVVPVRTDDIRSTAFQDWSSILQLTSEQRSELAPLDEQVGRKLEKSTLQLSQIRLALCDLLRRNELDPRDIDKYTDEIGRLHAREEKIMITHLLDMKKTLTDDQENTFFTTIMKDICIECQNVTDIHNCQCGFCSIHD